MKTLERISVQSCAWGDSSEAVGADITAALYFWGTHLKPQTAYSADETNSASIFRMQNTQTTDFLFSQAVKCTSYECHSSL